MALHVTIHPAILLNTADKRLGLVDVRIDSGFGYNLPVLNHKHYRFRDLSSKMATWTRVQSSTVLKCLNTWIYLPQARQIL